MSQEGEAKRELTSWKEIADYFQVNVRTVQNWEMERGLPIHRFPGKRGPVSAVIAELEQWKNSKDISQNGVAAGIALDNTASQAGLPGEEVKRGQSRLFLWALASLVVIVILLGIVWMTAHRGVETQASAQKGPPAAYEIENNALVVMDAQAHVLFRCPFDKPLSKTVYLDQNPKALDPVRFEDVDGDGKVEVLFARIPKEFRPETSELICFSHDGTRLWGYLFNRKVATVQGDDQDPVYSLHNVTVMKVTENGPKAILTVAFQSPDFVTYVALLTCDGVVQHEYWHSGHIGHPGNLLVADRNHDGINEIYLGGISQGYHQATLVVLDPTKFAGASVEESPRYQLRGFQPGNELHRVMFPRSCINQAIDPTFNQLYRISLLGDEILAEVYEQPAPIGDLINYYLSGDLAKIRIDVSSAFERDHYALERNRTLDHHWTDQEGADLVSQIRDLKHPRNTEPGK